MLELWQAHLTFALLLFLLIPGFGLSSGGRCLVLLGCLLGRGAHGSSVPGTGGLGCLRSLLAQRVARKVRCDALGRIKRTALHGSGGEQLQRIAIGLRGTRLGYGSLCGRLHGTQHTAGPLRHQGGLGVGGTHQGRSHRGLSVVQAMGPAVSRLNESGKIPQRLTRPYVGLMPAVAQ